MSRPLGTEDRDDQGEGTPRPGQSYLHGEMVRCTFIILSSQSHCPPLLENSPCGWKGDSQSLSLQATRVSL